MAEKWRQEWDGFTPGRWNRGSVNVRDFIQHNYTPYDGNEDFLKGPTIATKKLWDQVMELSRQEREAGGVLDMDTQIISTITSHGPGYLDKDLETIVGFQTDKPFKRSLQPFGGIRMAQNACHENGYEVDPKVVEIFTKYRKTHNQGVFDVYTPEMRLARKSAIITGLPDAYGRGRIIGDYRRVALYGVDWLIEDKKHQLATSLARMTSENIRLREELADQLRALDELKELGRIYGFDISRPAANAQEAIQWLYFGYLAAVKEQNGAAMSLGRTSTFVDIYIQRDLEKGLITEEQAQEYVDHFIMKLRLVKFARTPEYNELFSGDPTWVTESIGGIGVALAIALESIFPPIPSEVILPLAGFTAARGTLSLPGAIIWATIGSVLGAWTLYGISRWVGLHRINLAADKIPGVSRKDVSKANDWFTKYGTWSVLIGRVIPVVRSLISIPAGFNRMNFLHFTGWTLLGSAVWNTILVSAGYLLGDQWCSIQGALGVFEDVVIAAVIVVIVWFVVQKVRTVIRNRKSADGNE